MPTVVTCVAMKKSEGATQDQGAVASMNEEASSTGGAPVGLSQVATAVTEISGLVVTRQEEVLETDLDPAWVKAEALVAAEDEGLALAA